MFYSVSNYMVIYYTYIFQQNTYCNLLYDSSNYNHISERVSFPWPRRHVSEGNSGGPREGGLNIGQREGLNM